MDVNQPSGGDGTPGGSDTQVQFNDSGAFGGDAGLVYNKSTDRLTMLGSLSMADATGIIDSNGNEQLIFQETASAVNQFEMKNSATGNVLQILAAGDDTDIGLNLVPKGNGAVTIDNLIMPTAPPASSLDLMLTADTLGQTAFVSPSTFASQQFQMQPDTAEVGAALGSKAGTSKTSPILTFRNAVTDIAEWEFTVPGRIATPVSLQATIYTLNTVGSGDVKLDLIHDGVTVLETWDALGTAATATTTITSTTTINTHVFALTASEFAAGDIVHIELQRDGGDVADTNIGDTQFLGGVIEINP